MFVVDMTIEKWVGNQNEADLIEKPNWNQIETAIRELDAENKTLVTLGINEDTYMSIGCGENKYIVTATSDNFNFYSLIDPSKSEQVETLVIGGQKGNYPANKYVDLLRCLLAARTFTELGKLDDLLMWEEDKSPAFV
jgi:Immunity protein Imm1